MQLLVKQTKKAEVRIRKDMCKGCGLCVFYCPVKHLRLSSTLNKRGVVFAQAKDETQCVGCGFCFFICPESCIEVAVYQQPEKKNGKTPDSKIHVTDQSEVPCPTRQVSETHTAAPVKKEEGVQVF